MRAWGEQHWREREEWLYRICEEKEETMECLSEDCRNARGEGLKEET